MSQEVEKGLSRRGRASQNVGFCDRTGRLRGEPSKHSATPFRGEYPQFLAKDGWGDEFGADVGLAELSFVHRGISVRAESPRLLAAVCCGWQTCSLARNFVESIGYASKRSCGANRGKSLTADGR